MFLVSQVSAGLVENFNIEIFSDTINVLNLTVCMIALLIELYLFIPFSVTLTIFQGHRSIIIFVVVLLNQLRLILYILIKKKNKKNVGFFLNAIKARSLMIRTLLGVYIVTLGL